MKLNWIVLPAIVMVNIVGFTATAADLGFEASAGGFSSYIWRGYRLSENALQMQPSVALTLGGFGANVWAEYDSDREEWLEVDTTASYSRSFDRLNLEIGYIHYDVQDGLDSDEIYIGGDYDCFLNPGIKVYVDVNEGSGAFIVAGISHPVELTGRAGLEFGVSVSMIVDNEYVAVDDNGQEFTGLFNGDLTVTGSIALGDHVTVSPMAGYTIALSDDASDAIGRADSDGDDAFLYGGVTAGVEF